METLMRLISIMWSMGTGADVMERIDAPVAGRLFSSFIMELPVYYPSFFYKKRESCKNHE
ncbi:MAG: hypothetical protein JW927_00085 [Deltaproteobacteria bacterium]|nr:hypothetical protein [Deltaproteobacteria bacterium]